MFFTSRKQYLSEGTREVKIGDDCNLPQLHRLNADFGFIVVALSGSTSTPKEYVLCEMGLDDSSTDAAKRVTPEFHSLSELEAFTTENVVDILNKYLFGDDIAGGNDMPMAI